MTSTEMKEIEWIGDKVLTRYGLMEPGMKRTVPIRAANSYIEQGRAKGLGKTEKQRGDK